MNVRHVCLSHAPADYHRSPLAKPSSKSRAKRASRHSGLERIQRDTLIRGSLRFATLGPTHQPIGPKWQDARRALCDQRSRKETAMTEIDSTFVEAEIKEHHAALMRQMVAIGSIICVMLILMGLH